MKFITFLKTKRFLIGLALFFLLTLFSVISLPSSVGTPYKIGLAVLTILLYSASQFYTSGQLSEVEAKEQTDLCLHCVDVLKVIDSTQNLRSNVFRWDKKQSAYCIWAYYNMDTDPAKNVTAIPKDKGCTGKAWTTKTQIWAERDRIFGNGEFALPPDQENKISRELEWICSTPIIHPKKKIVIAVLNFDSNKKVADPDNIRFIKEHAERVATELGGVLSRI